MECEILQSPMISYPSLLYSTTVLYDRRFKIHAYVIYYLYKYSNKTYTSCYTMGSITKSVYFITVRDTYTDVNGVHTYI